jgi:GNAT superfamily N-acetyltransferase
MSDPFPELPAPDLPHLDMRWTVELDGPKLRALLSEADTLQWFPCAPGKELEDTLSLWMNFSRYRLGITALWDGQIVGFGVLLPLPYKKMSHQTAFFLVVDPEWRRRGIGTSLLRNLMHLAKQRFHLEFIHADVYQGSPILPLLERAGFACCFTQDSYILLGDQLVARHVMQRPLVLPRPNEGEIPNLRRDG